MKLSIRFKDPDLIGEYLDAKFPPHAGEDERTARQETAMRKHADLYFEFGDYGGMQIDTETGEGRLLKRTEWERL